MRKRAFVVFFLMLVGASLFLFSLVKVTRIVPAIDASFVVEQGETYGPYDEGTGYHTNILGKSVLKGEVSVEGEGIYFTGEGYNIDGLKNVFIDNHYNFVIDPADDLYTFTFDNTEGTSESLVNFLLKEEYTTILALQSPVMRALGLVGIFLLLPMGLIMAWCWWPLATCLTVITSLIPNITEPYIKYRKKQ